MSVLTTDRLTLRPLTFDAADFVVALLNEPAWLRFIGDRGVKNVADARRYLEKGPLAMYLRFGFGHYLVQRTEDGAALGICGLVKRETLADFDLGFAFLEPYRCQGYAYESSQAALAHGKDVMGLKRVVAITAPDNVNSIRLLEKLGFAYERMTWMGENGAASKLFARGL